MALATTAPQPRVGDRDQSSLKERLCLPPWRRGNTSSGDELPKSTRNLCRGIRFGNEAASLGQIGLCRESPARCHDQFDWGPAGADRVGELKPVHRTVNVDVSKHHPDVRAALQYPNCFVGISRFDSLEARFPRPVYRARSEKAFILDNKNYWSLC